MGTLVRNGLMCSRSQTVPQFERMTFTCMLRIMHRLLCSRTGKVYIKVDMGERRKTLKIFHQRTWDRGGVEGTRLEAKGAKKHPRPKTALSRTDSF